MDACIDAVGDPRALELALRLTRKCGTVQAIGVYAERCEVHMGLFWIKALRHALRPRQRDRPRRPRARADVQRAPGPEPLVTHHMSLDDAPEAYALYDRREALKIVLEP